MTHHHSVFETVLQESRLIKLPLSSEVPKNALITIARDIHDIQGISNLTEPDRNRYTVNLAESVICLPTQEAIRAFAC